MSTGASGPAASREFTVLVIEDSPEIRRKIVRTLTRPDCRLMTADNGRTGLRMARELRPDVVITDLVMPEMDGFELLAALREDASLSQVLVLMLTAESSRETMRVGMTLGADDFLTKPFSSDELQDALEALLRKRGRVAETVRSALLEREAQLRRIFSDNLDGGALQSALAAAPPAEATLTQVRAPVLYSDLRDFIGLAAKLTADEVTEFLSLYFQRISESVLAFGATHLKLAGNGLVAVFGETGAAEAPATQAVQAAMAVQRTAAELGRWLADRHPDRGLSLLSVGVGLYAGPLSVGVGPSDQEPIIVGEALILAAALEQDARGAGWAVAAGRALLDEAGAAVRTGWTRRVTPPGGTLAVESVQVTGLQDWALSTQRLLPDDLQPTLRLNREALRRNVDLTVRAAKGALDSRLSAFRDHSFSRDGDKVRLAGFRLVRRIGAGGMSDVYLAEREDGSPLALKVLRTEGQTPESMARFVREYTLLSQIQSPGVVRIFGQGFSDAHAYIAMEYFERGDLRKRISSGLNPRSALSVAVQIAAALEAVHAHGIVHRDLKPENVMLRADDTVALVDFGIAKATGTATPQRELTVDGEMLGSPSYMSREQIAGKPVTPQSDLYSLGVMLYEMLTGQRPFAADSVLSLLSLHMRAEVPRLPERFAALQPVVDRLMARRPEDRYSGAAEVVADLERLRSAVE
jgi:CheY-like chemotaxis protein